MPFPEYKEVEEPLLAYIYCNGDIQYKIKSNESYNPLADYFRLSEEDREKTRDELFGDGRNEKAWSNRVQWARKSLNDYGYLEKNSGQGIWRLSSLGISAAEKIYLKYEYFHPFPEETTQATDIEPPKKIETIIYRILRDTALARQIKKLHNDECQLCGRRITISKQKNYSEAHHIKPLGGDHNGLDVRENIIVLCPDHHVQCDYGAIQLSLQDISSIPGHRISQEFIDYHNSTIFNKIA
jgi:hypothetical protein